MLLLLPGLGLLILLLRPLLAVVTYRPLRRWAAARVCAGRRGSGGREAHRLTVALSLPLPLPIPLPLAVVGCKLKLLLWVKPAGLLGGLLVLLLGGAATIGGMAHWRRCAVALWVPCGRNRIRVRKGVGVRVRL